MDSSLFISGSMISNEISVDEIENSVIEFFRQIDSLTRSVSCLEDFVDCVVFMELLNRINSSQFHLGGIDKDANNNWALLLKNLTYFVKSLERFYHNVLKITDFNSATYLDLGEISQNKNRKEIIKLVELVLGVIVQSEQKSDFIMLITQLDRKSQTILMQLMEKWIVSERLHTYEGGNDDLQCSWIEDSMIQSRISLNNSSIMQYNTQPQQPQQQIGAILKKIDELERENNNFIDKIEAMKSEIADKDRKIVAIEEQGRQKNEEIKKLKLQRDSMMLSLGLSVPTDSIEGVVHERDMKIAHLSRVIDEMANNSSAEKSKMEAEIELLNKKLTQLLKSSEQLQFYKEKYDEYAQVRGKLADADSKQKEFETILNDKESMIEMLKQKLLEFKSSYHEEKKKVIEKSIQVTDLENQIEHLKREGASISLQCQQAEEKLQEAVFQMEQLQFEEQQQMKYPNRESIGIKMKPRGLTEDLGMMICELQRENLLLKVQSGQKLGEISDDGSLLNLDDDLGSLKDQVGLLQRKLDEMSREKVEIEAKLFEFRKIDVEKIKEENERIKADYHTLLAKSISRKERLAAVNAEEAVRTLQDEVQSKELEAEKLMRSVSEVQAKLQASVEAKMMLEDGYEKRVKQLKVELDEVRDKMEVLEKENQQMQKQLRTKDDTFKQLFENRNDEISLLCGLLNEVRSKYNQIKRKDSHEVEEEHQVKKEVTVQEDDEEVI